MIVKAGHDWDPKMREDVFTELVLQLLSEHNEADSAEVFFNVKDMGEAASLRPRPMHGRCQEMVPPSTCL